MKKHKIKFSVLFNAFVVVGAMMLIFSCNKPLPQAVPNVIPPLNPGVTQTIGDKISTDANYSLYLELMKKTGMLPRLSDPNRVWTVFAPDNAAFARAGIPDVATLNAAFPAQVQAAIGMYSVIPGQQYLSSGLTNVFPSMQLPSSLKIADVPGLPVPLEMSIFPSAQNGFWVNNVPVVAGDQKFLNGVIHSPYVLVAPPQQLLRGAIFSNPDLTFFKAAVAYADQGKSGLESLDSLLNYAVLNMTVLVPNDNAMKTLIIGMVTQYLMATTIPTPTPQEAQAAAAAIVNAQGTGIFSNPALAAAAPPEDVYGLLAYHVLTTSTPKGFQPLLRLYSNNLKTAPQSFYTTLVNSSSDPILQSHPGVMITPTYTGQTISEISFRGLGTFPPVPNPIPYGGAAAKAVPAGNFWETNCVNGVYYVIDRVLLPQ